MQKIAHIFNKIDTNDNKFEFYPKEFNAKSFQEIINKEDKKIEINCIDKDDDFYKKYYFSFTPFKNNGDNLLLSKYDNDKIDAILDSLNSDILIISGDFWGIQKFIFDGLTSKKASKVLRSRSALIQLITFCVSEIIKEKLPEAKLVLFGAGKFLMLANYEEDYQNKINDIQKELNRYFLRNFFGQNGFILSTTKTQKERLEKQSEFLKEDLEKLAEDNEIKKLQKFDLKSVKENEIMINPFDEATTDDRICKFCSKRVVKNTIDEEECCDICYNQINLGKKLTNNNYINIIKSKNKKISHNLVRILQYKNKSYYARFKNVHNHYSFGDTFDISSNDYNKEKKIPKWSLNSYVKKENDKILSFKEYLTDENDKEISSGLMALKADIDKLGDTFREFYYNDFKLFNRLSREVDFFFSEYITYIIQKEYKNIYTVFAGGDDLFLIGEYREIISLAKRVRDDFCKLSLQKTTLSMGLVMFKPSTPINYISNLADEAESRAKNRVINGKDRNGIDIFGITMKFEEFLRIEEYFEIATTYLKEKNLENMSFYYRIIELCDMREKINEDIKNALWKSKLNYIFRRNIYDRLNKEEKDESLKNIQTCIHILIEKYGEKFKPSIFLKIYQLRDEKRSKKDAL